MVCDTVDTIKTDRIVDRPYHSVPIPPPTVVVRDIHMGIFVHPMKAGMSVLFPTGSSQM